MSFTFTAKGQREMRIRIRNMDRVTKRGIRQGFYKVGRSLKDTANKAILEKPKSGRTYRTRRGGRRFRHIASAPGETFANLTGSARRTLGFHVRGADSLEFGFRRNAHTEYTKVLEDPNGLNRPALKNAIRANRRNSVVLLEREIEKAVSK